jgi:hypothetical protein
MSYLLTCLVVLSISALPSLATTYDVAADFSPTSNPAGAWSYGWSSELTSPFDLYTFTFNDRDIDNWTITDTSPPSVSHNGTSGEITLLPETITWQPGQFALHPGAAGEYSHARWTAPADGTCGITAEFTGIDQTGTTTDVHVLHNGVSLFSGSVVGFGDTELFSTNISVDAGDAISFAVGYGTGGYWDDTTALAATISHQTPVDASTWGRVKVLYR